MCSCAIAGAELAKRATKKFDDRFLLSHNITPTSYWLTLALDSLPSLFQALDW